MATRTALAGQTGQVSADRAAYDFGESHDDMSDVFREIVAALDREGMCILTVEQNVAKALEVAERAVVPAESP